MALLASMFHVVVPFAAERQQAPQVASNDAKRYTAANLITGWLL